MIPRKVTTMIQNPKRNLTVARGRGRARSVENRKALDLGPNLAAMRMSQNLSLTVARGGKGRGIKNVNLKAAKNLILMVVKVGRRGKRRRRDMIATQTPAVSLISSLMKVRRQTESGTAPYPLLSTTWQM
jgi:hypothetical protein